MKLTQLILATALVIAVGDFSAGAAERGKGRGERPGFGADRPGFGGERRPPGGRPQFMENLSEEGRRALMEAYKQMRSSGQELQQKVMRLRKELGQMLVSGEVDEKAIRNKVMAIAEVEADITVMRARMFARMKEAGVPEETLKMMALRMGGGQPGMRGPGGEGMWRGGEGMRRGGFGGREGFGGKADLTSRRPERGAPKEGEARKRRPEFEQ